MSLEISASVLKSRKEGKAGMKTLEKILAVRDKRGTAKTNKKLKSRANPHEQREKRWSRRPELNW
jgi:hypothetical protein